MHIGLETIGLQGKRATLPPRSKLGALGKARGDVLANELEVGWWQRVEELIPDLEYGFYSMEMEKLKERMRHYGAEYLVTSHGSRFRSLTMDRVYPADGVYSLFEVYRREP